MGFSFIAGPLIGGLLADHAGWRWVFLVNLPIGAAALAIVATVLPASVGRSEHRGARIDFAGIALLTAAIGLVLVGLNQHAHAGWADWRTSGLVAAGVAAARRVHRGRAPRGRAGRSRSRCSPTAARRRCWPPARPAPSGSTRACSCSRATTRASATSAPPTAGLLIYPLLIGLVISVNVAAAMIVRRGEYRTPIIGGLAFLALGALGFATFDASTPDWESLLFMALIGIGVGPTLSGLQIAMQRTVTPIQIGAAMGTLLLLRQVGGAVALAAAETIYVAGDTPATGTGAGVFAVSLAGAALAAIALLTLPRAATRFAPARQDVAHGPSTARAGAVPADGLGPLREPVRSRS